MTAKAAQRPRRQCTGEHEEGIQHGRRAAGAPECRPRAQSTQATKVRAVAQARWRARRRRGVRIHHVMAVARTELTRRIARAAFAGEKRREFARGCRLLRIHHFPRIKDGPSVRRRRRRDFVGKRARSDTKPASAFPGLDGGEGPGRTSSRRTSLGVKCRGS